MQVLKEMGEQEDSLIVTAMLLAPIRIHYLTFYRIHCRKAPLLKHMVTQLDDKTMAVSNLINEVVTKVQSVECSIYSKY